MSEVHLLWFTRDMPEGEDDVQLLIGVYSSTEKAQKASERLQQQPGFADFPQGFEIASYQLDRDHWTEGFSLDKTRRKT